MNRVDVAHDVPRCRTVRNAHTDGLADHVRPVGFRHVASGVIARMRTWLTAPRKRGSTPTTLPRKTVCPRTNPPDRHQLRTAGRADAMRARISAAASAVALESNCRAFCVCPNVN